MDKDGNLQTSAICRPSEWSSRQLSQTQIDKIKYIDQADDVNTTHYRHLYDYLEKKIKIMAAEQIRENGQFKDNIDTEVEKIK